MEAGRRDRRISIERAVETTDGLGGTVHTWLPLAMVWAEVEPLSDGERWRAQEVAAHVTHRFRILWGVGVLPTDRVVYDGRVFDVSGVREIGRQEGQELTAAARAE